MDATLRCLENVPILGHLLAAGYACSRGGRSKAERAALKATVGILLCPVNLVAEIVDEGTRKRSKKLRNDVPLTSRPDWMKRHRTKTLRSLCLPGTHESGSFEVSKRLRRVPCVEGWSRCQKVDTYRQLLAGIRFLDFRVVSVGNEIWTHADFVRCVRLREILTRVRDFVSDHPTEIVVLHISKDDRKSIDWNACHSLIHEFFKDRLIPEHMRDLLIGDLIDQGKSIVLCGMTDVVSSSWQQIQTSWPNKQSPEQLGSHMRTTLQEMGLYRPTGLFWYKAECTPSSAMYVRSIGGVPGLVASRRGAVEKFDFIEDLAAATNYSILQVLRDVNRLPFNLLSIDYVHDDVIERILKLNDVPDQMLTLSQHISSTDMSSDEVDDVFVVYASPASAASSASAAQQKLINNSTMNSSVAGVNSSVAGVNSSFDFRGRPKPPVHVKETMM